MSTPPTLCFSISDPTLLESPIQPNKINRAPFQKKKCPQAEPHHLTTLQITSLRLLPLDSLKQTLKVPRSEAIKLVPLNDLNEHRRAIHQWFREKLQEIPTLIEVN